MIADGVLKATEVYIIDMTSTSTIKYKQIYWNLWYGS